MLHLNVDAGTVGTVILLENKVEELILRTQFLFHKNATKTNASLDTYVHIGCKLNLIPLTFAW